MLTTVTELAAQAGSKLDLPDERAAGTAQAFTCSAVLTGLQQAAVQVLTVHDLGVLVAPPGTGKTVMRARSSPRIRSPLSSAARLAQA